MNVFGGILESANPSVRPCVRLCTKYCTSFFQNPGRGIKSHLVTALVDLGTGNGYINKRAEHRWLLVYRVEFETRAVALNFFSSIDGSHMDLLHSHR